MTSNNKLLRSLKNSEIFANIAYKFVILSQQAKNLNREILRASPSGWHGKIMATAKSKSSSHLGRDSQPHYLGVKASDGQKVKIGAIIIRQKGSKYTAGKNVGSGRDFTLFALKDGAVKFQTKNKISFTGAKKQIKVVNVVWVCHSERSEESRPRDPSGLPSGWHNGRHFAASPNKLFEQRVGL